MSAVRLQPTTPVSINKNTPPNLVQPERKVAQNVKDPNNAALITIKSKQDPQYDTVIGELSSTFPKSNFDNSDYGFNSFEAYFNRDNTSKVLNDALDKLKLSETRSIDNKDLKIDLKKISNDKIEFKNMYPPGALDGGVFNHIPFTTTLVKKNGRWNVIRQQIPQPADGSERIADIDLVSKKLKLKVIDPTSYISDRNSGGSDGVQKIRNYEIPLNLLPPASSKPAK